MGEIFSYSIESGIILILLYIAYKLTMSGERQFGTNRATIYSIYAGALILPWAYPAIVQIAKGRHGYGTAALDMDIPAVFTGTAVSDESAPIWPEVILWVYLAGVAIAFIRLIISIVRIVRIANSRERHTLDNGYTLVLTDEREFSPFSFMRYIVISREDYEKSRKEILTHELTHLRLCHWVDQLIGNGVAIFIWYNPAAWLMIEELKSIHEYQADAAVIDSGADIKSYQYLLIEKAVGKRFPSPANSLNHSKLKKRVTMMYKSKPSAMRRLAGIAVIPSAIAALAITNLPAVAEVLSETGSASLHSVSDGKVSNNSSSEQTAGGKSAGKGLLKEESAGTLKMLDPIMVVAYKSEPTGSRDGGKEVCEAPEVLPEFPGGINAMMQWLSMNVRYPKEAHDQDIQGKVVVRFVVTKEGKVTDPSIMKSIAPSLDAEALRVVGEMPEWTPGKNGSVAVDCGFALPINFKLQTAAKPDKE